MTTTPFEQRHEDEASPRVAAVFADIRTRMTFVPALFKALAVDEDALEHAWLQARSVFAHRGFAGAVRRVREAASASVPVDVSPELYDAVLPFAADLPGMLVVASSLRGTLDGELQLGGTVGRIEPGVAPPEPIVPELRGEHPLYRSIREEYGTAHVPTLYRSLAARDLLDEGWQVAASVLRSPAGAERIAHVAEVGRAEARRLHTVGCFTTESARHVVDQLVVALPRNLVVVLAIAPRE